MNIVILLCIVSVGVALLAALICVSACMLSSQISQNEEALGRDLR